MNKKVISIIFVIALVVQIFVPIGMIEYGKVATENLETKGIEYKFKIRHIDIYNGRCNFLLEEQFLLSYLSDYVVISEDALDGYAYFDKFEERKPKVNNYIRFTDRNNIKLRDFDTGIKDADFWNIDETNAYAIIKVYNGDVLVTNVYIDNMPVTEWIEAQK